MFGPQAGFQVPPAGPARRHVQLAADAAKDIPPELRPRRLYCNATGNITVRDENGVDLAYVGAAGLVIEIMPVRIMAITGTWFGWL